MKRRVALVPTNIILLQNVVKKDPESYTDEFLQQLSHYNSLKDLFLSNPQSANTDEFCDSIGFISAVCNHYPEHTKNFPADLQQLLGTALPFELADKIINSLSMLRNKGVISAEFLLQAIFPMLTNVAHNVAFHTKLKTLIYHVLISLLKSCNTGTKNQKLNRATQSLLFNLLEKRNSDGIWATKLTRELWRRKVWDDSRTVELMTQAALHPDTKVCIAGVRFFLGADQERMAEEDQDSDEEIDMSSLRHKLQINKKTGRRAKKLSQAAKKVKAQNNKLQTTFLNFSAIQLLRDPQGFADALFLKQLTSKNFKLDQKILLMNLISRLVGTHKLIVLGLYSYFLKYLKPKQENVTQIMASVAQSSHDLVPPEVLNEVVRKIANEFVSDGVSAEVCSAGLNCIREVLSRAPLAIDDVLLQDLIEYKGSKSKAVVAAARGLLSLYREISPDMLKRKDRGKEASIKLSHKSADAPKYGEQAIHDTVPGLELLDKWKQENEHGADEWEVDSDGGDADDIEGEWVKVDSDADIDISDSDDAMEDAGDAEDTGDAEDVADSADSDLDLSDAEDEAEAEAGEISAEAGAAAAAETQLLTPADFAKLDELKFSAGVELAMGIKTDETVDGDGLVGNVKYKQTKEERLEHVREGREGREKFGSRKGRREANHSTTNKEKARRKNFVMMIHKRSVQGKQKMSLRDRQKVLKEHVKKQKRKN